MALAFPTDIFTRPSVDMGDEDTLPEAGDLSSHSESPGSASDHMGALPSLVVSSAPLFPGSSDLAKLALMQQKQQQQQQQQLKEQSMNVDSNRDSNSIHKGINVVNTTSTTTTSSTSNRRQKRLQRNRESARLSRRRRKQYLEVLEERVVQMSHELDENRRNHVLQAVRVIHYKRTMNCQDMEPLQIDILSRTSPELRVATTFVFQQLRSLSVPSANHFVLWLTLQPENYFRGGRAASERLSAARIGERILNSGTKCAGPSQNMWPLLCNEIVLSYDQEEKLRHCFQKQLLQDTKSFLHRHQHYASKKLLTAAHDAVQALTLRAGQREASSHKILSAAQRKIFHQFSIQARDRISALRKTMPTRSDTSAPSQRDVTKDQHVAANLYILREKLHAILDVVPRAPPLVTGLTLKKLSRRACFESLGSCDDKETLKRENSFASSGSLKRNASEMSIDNTHEDDEMNKTTPAPVSFCPVEAQAAAAGIVEQHLGHVKDLWPVPPPIIAMTAPSVVLPLPQTIVTKPVLSSFALGNNNMVLSTPLVVQSSSSTLAYQAPLLAQSAPSLPTYSGVPASKHSRKTSFLPQVPEEMWNDNEAEQFLMDMLDDGDWAIGEGIDMDLPS